ncbi:hypothetical protein FB562_0582 [Homoserinimonas aerilata]|uniref:DUF6458 domain-containing protein n=1 Tax=Homoserinimonas aerilata TaxID=1162970 RepID=A0A542YHE2_9MICO|nr:DUF6458 family protein [Homoserinimonas aerilata]TQL47519.1 hypothetical protein FB562_0582 [Homoserinimonas aerilata]
MGIGTGIFLFVVGAIVTFALNFEVEWANLDLIGYILMGAGFIVFVISLILVMRKRSSVETVRRVDGAGEQVVERETRSDSGTTELH